MRLWVVPILLLAITGICSAESADLKLKITNPVGRVWVNEPINWGITLAKSEWRGGKVLLKRDGKPIPAQAAIIDRYDDRAVKTAKLSFIIDRLDKDASTTISAHLGQAGPTETDLSIREEPGVLMLANQFTAVKLINRNVANDVQGEFFPILGVRTASGRWTGAGHYETQTIKPVGTRTELLEKGPVRLAARVTTTSTTAALTS